MNTSKYKVFLKGAELGNITRAAQELNYTQSGVSQIISSLERELGFPLRVRTKAGTVLTSSGERVLESIRQGHIAYVINTSDSSSSGVTRDGFEIRKYATENNVTMFTSLDTVRVLLDVLEETTNRVSTIDS